MMTLNDLYAKLNKLEDERCELSQKPTWNKDDYEKDSLLFDEIRETENALIDYKCELVKSQLPILLREIADNIDSYVNWIGWDDKVIEIGLDEEEEKLKIY